MLVWVLDACYCLAASRAWCLLRTAGLERAASANPESSSAARRVVTAREVVLVSMLDGVK